MFLGVFLGVVTGGDAFLLHYLLRLFLWRTGTLPWLLVAFLDDMTARLLLRRVGGSYVFTHRLLLEHLASQQANTHAGHTAPERHQQA